jgi:hypothetical protein
MAVEIGGDAGGGSYGAQLDEIAEMPAGAPPISYFVAAWLVRASTPAARAAADLMGPRNYRCGDRHVVAFPPLSAPNFCVQIVSGPVDAISARNVVRLAGLMRS